MGAAEFDEGALHRLIDTALDAVPARAPQPLPLTMMNTALFERVAAILAEHLPPGDVTAALDELRVTLYDGIDRGDLPQLHTIIRSCRKCPSVEQGARPCSPVGNLLDPDLVVVHELPVREHLIEERFATLVAEAGFAPARVAHTSAVRCDPATVRPPSAEELANCRRYLTAELQLLAPKLIMTLGATALSTVLDAAPVRVTTERGTIFWLGPWPVLPTFALSYTLRSDAARDALSSDLRAAYTFIYG